MQTLSILIERKKWKYVGSRKEKLIDWMSAICHNAVQMDIFLLFGIEKPLNIHELKMRCIHKFQIQKIDLRTGSSSTLEHLLGEMRK